jgi:chromate transporter
MSHQDPAAHAPSNRPTLTAWQVFVFYTIATLKGFGGTFFWIRRGLTEDLKVITEAEFAEYFALSQLLPGGANLFNMALLLGHRFAGVRGAFAAGAGFVFVPFFVMVLMAFVYLRFGAQPLVNKALTGMFAVVVGMMLSNAWKMGQAVPKRVRAWTFCLVTFVAVGVLRLPLVWVMLALGPIAVSIAWRELIAERAARQASNTTGRAS